MSNLRSLLALAGVALVHGLPRPGLVERKVDVPFDQAFAQPLDDRAITLSSNLEVTTSYSSVISSLQSASVTVSPSLTGTILTGLPSGGFTRDPLKTSDLPEPTGSLAPIDATLEEGPTAPAGNVAGNIFVPMATDAPPQQITSRDDHVVKKLNIVDEDVPIQTNKFFANFFLGNQTQPVWTNPYALSWAKGHGNSFGMVVTHIERSQLAWAPGDVPQYFIGPSGQQHIVLSAQELGEETVLSTESPTAFSVFANLAPSANSKPLVSLPCVQGMGFVTALYNGAKPVLNSGTFFRTLKFVEQLNGITYKYRVTLEDSTEWLIYATPVASLGAPPFELKDSANIVGPEGFIGMIQVAKNPASDSGEKIYDSTAGSYAVNATLTGTVDRSSGSYTLDWGKGGVQNQTLLMFALPHHVESFDEKTATALTGIELATITKGIAKAIVADKMTMVENNLPNTIGFAPWVPAGNGGNGGSDNTDLMGGALALVNNVGAVELSEDFDKQTRLDSMYYSGKGLAKFAGIIYTLQTMAKNTELAAAGLVKLKDAFNVFVNNTQPLPLVYDTVWKGVVSSGTYRTGDTGLDFGNALYNDHHFHYGYFLWTAAVIGYLDPAWMDQGTNRAWINTLVRDFANPSTSDPYFPFQRSFDWFHGHSWAKGLFESGDGKDQESSSEDTFSTYALKMWGRISGDAALEARGNLQLAVQARSVRNYFLLASDNTVQPERFRPNKVTGILFENKVDHTTYFGASPEFVQGIHMIPLNPSTAYTRPAAFVKEEWDAYFSNGRADKALGGWRGILYANLATIDPQAAYAFFADQNFDTGLLDGGASRTWYLAYAAAMAGGGGSFDQTANGTQAEAAEAASLQSEPALEGAPDALNESEPVSDVTTAAPADLSSPELAPELTALAADESAWTSQDQDQDQAVDADGFATDLDERSSDEEWYDEWTREAGVGERLWDRIWAEEESPSPSSSFEEAKEEGEPQCETA